jgi:type IV pilus assembly protein PilC
MPVYTYQAVDPKGRRLAGQMPAISEAQLEEKLTKTGAWLIDAQPHNARSAAEAAAGSVCLSARGIKRRDLIEFCTLMNFQTKVGLPLVQALEVASQDCENPKFRKILANLQQHLESGVQLYEALEKFPKIFPPEFTNVIQAGEISSKLPEAFAELRDYLEWVDRVLADVRQASLYPAIVLTVVLAFVVGLFTFIIPKFAALLTSVNVKLPLMTQIVFGVSDFVKGTWWIWFVALPLLVISVLAARRYSKRVAIAFDRMKLKLPIFGQLNLMLAISRFTHNLAILYRSGIPILQSLNLCQG